MSRGPADQEPSVEFIVKADEDLYLEGSQRTIPRVRAGNQYSCLMKVQQTFNSLFRHYAKHHGLRKDDLVYYFTEQLQPDDTPASVHLLKNDEIIVRKKREEEKEAMDPMCSDETYFQNFSRLLSDTEHCDCSFVLSNEPDEEPISAHKAVLTARGEYFRAAFRKGGMRESSSSTIQIDNHVRPTVQRMLEFIYTNKVAGLSKCNANEILHTLRLAEEFLLPGLKSLCEREAKKQMNRENVVQMLFCSDKYDAEHLRCACMDFITANSEEVVSNPTFQNELKAMPHLFIPILETLAQAANNGGRPTKRLKVEKCPAAVSSK
uniref:BTB domain-containing protein n=1 Tax=Phaeomonas parva TaxID=124430 RepID=A0A6U4KVI1_9STRA|mmetsp:Transcript_6949/g.20306  ORF Transcript_6949/g.20306 Transcript_6949/m.20306 type:complete len:321 (+) Transcript_6949:243-1205(+)